LAVSIGANAFVTTDSRQARDSGSDVIDQFD